MTWNYSPRELISQTAKNKFQLPEKNALVNYSAAESQTTVHIFRHLIKTNAVAVSGKYIYCAKSAAGDANKELLHISFKTVLNAALQRRGKANSFG